MDSSDFDKGLAAAEKKSKTLFSGLASVGGGIVTGIGVIGAAMGGMAISAGMTAAKVDQLQMVTTIMAENAGWSASMINEQRKALRSSGITAGGTENALQSLMAANLDVAKATDLSRLAQNLAVKTGEDSTQTFLQLVAGIERGDAEMIKSAGMTVDLSKAQKVLAEELGKSVGQLTAVEKQQAAWNAVVEQSPVYDGLYEAAMKQPIKQLGSLKRLFNDLSVGIGNYFTPAISDVIAGFSSFIKVIIEAVSEGGALEPLLSGLGDIFSKVGKLIGDAFVTAGEKLPEFLANIQATWAWLQANEGVIVGVFAGLGVAVLAFGISVATAAWTALVPLLPIIAVMLLVAAVAYLVYEAWTNNWGGIQEKTKSVLDWIQDKIQKVMDAIQPIVAAALDFINGLVETWGLLMEGNFREAGEKLRTTLTKTWGKLKQSFVDLWDKIVENFKDIDWAQLGKDIINGLINGLASMAGMLWSTVKDIAEGVAGFFKGLLDISSPSGVFFGYGENIMKGLALGIKSSVGMPMKELSNTGFSTPNLTGRNAGGSNIFKVSISISGNANENDVRNGVRLGIGDAMKARGAA